MTKEEIEYKSLNIICKILKTQAGLYNCEIAKDVGVAPTLLCKWQKGVINISEHSLDKLIDYFAQDKFQTYQYQIAQEIIRCFGIQENGTISWTMHHLAFKSMLEYILKGLHFKDIELEQVENSLYRQSVTAAIAAKLNLLNYSFDVISNQMMSIEMNEQKSICAYVEEVRVTPVHDVLLIYGDKTYVEEYSMEWLYLFIRETSDIVSNIQYVIAVNIPELEYVKESPEDTEYVCDMTVRKILATIYPMRDEFRL